MGKQLAGATIADRSAQALISVPGEVTSSPIARADQAQSTIKSVKDDPAFGKKVTHDTWKFRPSMQDSSDHKPSWFERFFKTIEPWIEAALEGMAWFWQGLGYVIVAFLLVAIIVLVVVYSGSWSIFTRREPDAGPQMMFGLDVRADSLPTDLVGAARSALEAGEAAQALSLLYRGALVFLIHRQQVRFHRGDTEEDCVQRVAKAVDDERFRYFRNLLDARSLLVYAHRRLAREQVESLIDHWVEHFGIELMGKAGAR
jgi:hypothetical protein